MRTPRHPAEVLEGIAAEIDDLHAWQGGGIVFGRKPFLGEIKRSVFRIRALSYRRDGSVAFLVGQVVPIEDGALVRYRIENPTDFIGMLPYAAMAPVVLFGTGGYFSAPVFAPSGGVASVGVISCCCLVGGLLAALVVAIVLYGIRRDNVRLLSFVKVTIDG